MIGVFAGENDSFLAAFWCRGRQCIKMAGTSRRPKVAMPQRRDVESTYKEVNKRQRRDVSAPNVATLQRRDVSTSFSSQSLKEKGGPEFERRIGDQGTYELGHENQNNSDIDLEEELVICIFLRFGQ